jgi:hypothetical protein
MKIHEIEGLIVTTRLNIDKNLLEKATRFKVDWKIG